MSNGFYIPKDPEVYRRWHENATFDEEAYLKTVRSTVLSPEQLAEYRQVTAELTSIAKLLKCNVNETPNRLRTLKQNVEDMKAELQ